MTQLNAALTVPFDSDAPHRKVFVGNEPMVFHCHHYNTFLQQTIQDATYIESQPFLVGAGHSAAFEQLVGLFAAEGVNDTATRKKLASELYRWAGFGFVDFSSLTEQGGSLITKWSHYSHAWKVKFGKANAPVDYFTAGWIAGALAAIYGLPADTFSSVQTQCIAVGDDVNRFEIAPSGANYSVFGSPGHGPLTTHAARPIPASGVDYEGIYAALSGMDLQGDEHGSMPAFGVYLTRHYANYYNRISFEFLRAMEGKFGETGIEVAEPLLVEAGHVCAFNTFGGIMTSAEWDGLIKPQLESREDWVHGIVAAVNALGWGRWQVTKLSKNEAEFVIHDDYESVGHLAAYGESAYSAAYLAEGAARGIMNLVYVGDVATKPAFTHEFYQKLFKSDLSYDSEVLSSRSRGDDVTAFRIFAP